MKNRWIVLFSGLVIAFAFSLLLIRLIMLERRDTWRGEQLLTVFLKSEQQQQRIQDLERENVRQQEQIARIRETATQARESFKRIGIMCGKTPTGASISWIGLTKEAEDDLNATKEALKAISKEQ
jgi:hypothetical protein